MRSLVQLTILVLLLSGCKKQNEWLDEKRNNSDVTPSTLSDLQAVMDHDYMYTGFLNIALMGTDNLYVQSSDLSGIPVYQRNAYLWNKDIFENTNEDGGYLVYYTIVAYANIVLEGLAKTDVTEATRVNYNNIKGQALFYRSFMFYNLMNLFSLPFDSSTAATNLGIPLRVTSSINEIYPRASVKDCYNRIIADLQESATLLPVNALYKTRPSKSAAFALMAKTCLVLHDHKKARDYADSALYYNNVLLDFNSSAVSLTPTYRFPNYAAGNPEIVLYSTGSGGNIVTPSTLGVGYVDSTLYSSYDGNDLRKVYYFLNVSGNTARYRGSYSGINQNFLGISNNEVYFIRAECNARLGNTAQAVADLNTVLRKRYKTGFYTDFATVDAEAALYKILTERRKELPFTAHVRWEDLRRLNKDSRFAVTLTRVYNNTIYTLAPGSKRYAYPIPNREIELSGLQQNER